MMEIDLGLRFIKGQANLNAWLKPDHCYLGLTQSLAPLLNVISSLLGLVLFRLHWNWDCVYGSLCGHYHPQDPLDQITTYAFQKEIRGVYWA
ncbi:hypothetical protein VNO77_44624 [Canavalia gladiata]|uniref:Uncharacterized protein n=1 Tax=Canavalia gladiata TaxID=3824 RepID=A0AAN9JX15_CANGL